jgi:hypothetical protein
MAALAMLALALAGVRVSSDSAFWSAIATFLVGLGAAVATGAMASCLWLAGRTGLHALSGARQRQQALADARKQEQDLKFFAAKQRFLEGGDLRDEVRFAEASLEKLRAAIRAMEEMRAGILEPAAPDFQEEYERLRDEIEAKIDLGRRVLVAAEAAAFRLACAEPLRRLLRRRPSEAMKELSQADGAAKMEARIASVSELVQAFIHEIPEARKALSTLEARRPAIMTLRPEGDSAEDVDRAGGEDPLQRVQRELDAIESAYRNVLERTRVIEVRLATRTEMEEVARAAGTVTASAQALGLGENELGRLIEEIGRAESAMAIVVPAEGNLDALRDALARSAAALDSNDTATLAELVEAMKEIG